MKVNSGPIHDEFSFAYNQKLQRQKYKAYDLRRSMGNMTLKSQVTPCKAQLCRIHPDCLSKKPHLLHY